MGEKTRVLIVAGSSRKKTNCPAVDGKAIFFAKRAREKLYKNWTVDFLDLSNDFGMHKIQSCNACVSTSMALCVWPCNCYKKNSISEPDLMWDEDVYGRIYAADIILICAPVNWYAPSSNIKLMFDRLVCANGGNPDEKLINHKDAKLAAALQKSKKWKELSKNHLEGRTIAFFIYGDYGADEIAKDGRPKILEHKEYFNPKEEVKYSTPKFAYTPIIWQCRYSGIEAPEHLIKEVIFGSGKAPSDNQIKELKENEKVLKDFDSWIREVRKFADKKGKVKMGKYPVPLGKPNSDANVFFRNFNLFYRTTIQGLWTYSIGYVLSRIKSKQYALNKS